MRQLRVDPEFRDKVPPLTETELKTLEENIIKDGRVLVPILVWNDTIVDGHNRYSIVQKHPGIPFKVEDMTFADRYEAIVWICRNQLGRRNLTDEQKTYLIGKQYEAQKQTQAFKGNQYTKSGDSQNGNNQNGSRTVDKIAAEHSVGANTVVRAEKFAKGVDVIESAAPGAKEKLLSGKVQIPKSVVAQIPSMNAEERIEVIQNVIDGKPVRPRKKPLSSADIDLLEKISEDLKSMDKEPATEERYADDFRRILMLGVDDARLLLEEKINDFDEAGRKKIIAALVEAEQAIKEMKGLIET